MNKEQKKEQLLDNLIAELNTQHNQYQFNILAQIGKIHHPRAEKILIDFLKNEDASFRARAARNLKNIGTYMAVVPLIFALNDEEELVRAYAACSLGKIGNSSAVDSLIVSLKNDRSSYVREYVAAALGNIASPHSVESLIFSLKNDESISVRGSSASSLGEISDIRAVEPLIDAFKNDLGISDTVIEALGEIGDPRAIKPLINFLENENVFVQEAIHKSPIKVKVYMTDDPEEDTDENWEFLFNVNKELFRQSIAKALGKIGGYRAPQILIKLLDTDNEWTLLSVLRALSNFDKIVSYKPLVKLLKNDNYKVRLFALSLLKKFKWEPKNIEEELAYLAAIHFTYPERKMKRLGVQSEKT